MKISDCCIFSCSLLISKWRCREELSVLKEQESSTSSDLSPRISSVHSDRGTLRVLTHRARCWNQATSLIKNVASWKEEDMPSEKAELDPNCRVIIEPGWSRMLDQRCPVVPCSQESSSDS